ncbi:cytochrome P450 [Ascobolus immersus RN42]|uniref:Cytochrome P450 n=1 Tax=Ascobolus immersus RN42 TaxID=1160509 RepID=A0A3N4I8Z9_ASCIM|nr:cytochrome P450 [Ascobolus immersus RN42]
MSLSSLTPYLLTLLLLYPIIRLYRNWVHRSNLFFDGCAEPYTFPTGPFGLPYITTLIRAFQASTHLPLLTSHFHLAGRKTFTFSALGMTNINTMDAENFRKVLSTGFTHFGFGSMRKANFASSFGTHGFFTIDGEEWVRARALVRPQFVFRREQMLEMMGGNFEGAFQRWLGKVRLDGEVVDLQPLFERLTLETSLKFLWGVEMDGKGEGGLNMSEEELGEFEGAFNGVQIGLAYRHLLQALYFLGGGREFNKQIRVLHSFVDRLVDSCIALLPDANTDSALSTDDSDKPKKYYFIHHLLSAGTPKEHLRDHTLNVLIAARDSTALTLSFLLSHLAYEPVIFHALRSQILAIYGPTLSTLLAKLAKNGPDSIETTPPLLANCLSECLRLHPPIPLNQRYAFRDTSLPRGGGPDGTEPIFVAKGQRVDLNFYALHRDKDVWGADADEFRPERWEEMENGTRRKVTAWEYQPFSSGKRICLGRGFAKVWHVIGKRV